MHYSSHMDPWYIEPRFSNRWGFTALMRRAAGKPVPGDEGEKFMPKGYVISEVGPEGLRGRGKNEMAETRTKLVNDEGRYGCPFSSW